MVCCSSRASALRRPCGVRSQPAAIGFNAAVLKPWALAAASRPAVITVLPTSVSVPVMKYALAMGFLELQIPDLISGRQQAIVTALRFVSGAEALQALARGKPAGAVAIDVMRTERLQFARQLAQLGIAQYDNVFAP